MKKLSLALATAGLTASLGAFAALPTDAQPFQVVIPNLENANNVFIEGLYLQPTRSDLDYATISNFNATGSTTINGNVDVKTVDPDYNFGFRIGLGYTPPDTGNDVQLSWLHFNHTDSDTTEVPNLSTLTTRLGHMNWVDNATGDEAEELKLKALKEFLETQDSSKLIYDEASVTSDVKFKLDAVDLDVGQYVDIGTRLRVRAFGGLRFARLENDQSTSVLATGEIPLDLNEEKSVNGKAAPLEDRFIYIDDYEETFNSKFTGLGPRFGVDTNYHLGNCFGLAASGSVALLVGKVDTSTNSNQSLTFDIPDIIKVEEEFEDLSITYPVNSSDSIRVVPAFDLKLGLNYSYIFDNESVLTIEGGYQVTQYIDAIDRLEGSVDIDAPNIKDMNKADSEEKSIPFPAPADIERKTSSVGFDGPYLRLNWKV